MGETGAQILGNRKVCVESERRVCGDPEFEAALKKAQIAERLILAGRTKITVWRGCFFRLKTV